MDGPQAGGAQLTFVNTPSIHINILTKVQEICRSIMCNFDREPMTHCRMTLLSGPLTSGRLRKDGRARWRALHHRVISWSLLRWSWMYFYPMMLLSSFIYLMNVRPLRICRQKLRSSRSPTRQCLSCWGIAKLYYFRSSTRLLSKLSIPLQTNYVFSRLVNSVVVFTTLFSNLEKT